MISLLGWFAKLLLKKPLILLSGLPFLLPSQGCSSQIFGSLGSVHASILPFFSFIVNGHHTSWIKSSRGVRQGDPISLLLFILVSQNLTTILNKALHLDMIHSFNENLSKNFNHLMFTDDLILVTKASRKMPEIVSCTLMSIKLSLIKNQIC